MESMNHIVSHLHQELTNCWTDKGPEFKKIVKKIADYCISTRDECMVILALFKGNNDELTKFLEVAEEMNTLKPATVPSLALSIGLITEEEFRKENVVNVLSSAA